eukprot:TRINITY_DN1119_c0_g2_i1.p1 TRINITY_DN1119_c0_g2~~TRINITY_DN1119_c0_g2_i1.p1  ORF type:complete len:1203 (-),score=291.69 TRINITY_DN1119_c0_g2_i1:63-3671(-)
MDTINHCLILWNVQTLLLSLVHYLNRKDFLIPLFGLFVQIGWVPKDGVQIACCFVLLTTVYIWINYDRIQREFVAQFMMRSFIFYFIINLNSIPEYRIWTTTLWFFLGLLHHTEKRQIYTFGSLVSIVIIWFEAFGLISFSEGTIGNLSFFVFNNILCVDIYVMSNEKTADLNKIKKENEILQKTIEIEKEKFKQLEEKMKEQMVYFEKQENLRTSTVSGSPSTSTSTPDTAPPNTPLPSTSKEPAPAPSLLSRSLDELESSTSGSESESETSSDGEAIQHRPFSKKNFDYQSVSTPSLPKLPPKHIFDRDDDLTYSSDEDNERKDTKTNEQPITTDSGEKEVVEKKSKKEQFLTEIYLPVDEHEEDSINKSKSNSNPELYSNKKDLLRKIGSKVPESKSLSTISKMNDPTPTASPTPTPTPPPPPTIESLPQQDSIPKLSNKKDDGNGEVPAEKTDNKNELTEALTLSSSSPSYTTPPISLSSSSPKSMFTKNNQFLSPSQYKANKSNLMNLKYKKRSSPTLLQNELRIPTQSHSKQQKPSAVFVSQDKILVDSMDEMIRRLGWSLYIANTGADGIRLTYEYRCSVILVDLRINDIDPFDIPSTLEDRNMHIPVVALSTSHSSDERKKCIQMGMYDYYRLPVKALSIDKLLREIKEDFIEKSERKKITKREFISQSPLLISNDLGSDLHSTISRKFAEELSSTEEPLIIKKTTSASAAAAAAAAAVDETASDQTPVLKKIGQKKTRINESKNIHGHRRSLSGEDDNTKQPSMHINGSLTGELTKKSRSSSKSNKTKNLFETMTSSSSQLNTALSKEDISSTNLHHSLSLPKKRSYINTTSTTTTTDNTSKDEKRSRSLGDLLSTRQRFFTEEEEYIETNSDINGLGISSLTNAFSPVDVLKLKQQFNHLEKIFSCFVPREYQELIAPNGIDKLKLGDTVCKCITILFSDIRDFTAMSEVMYIDDLMNFLNTYFAFALPPIEENGGFVDKFIGDAIMCIFAAPDQTTQAVNAVNAAISMLKNLDYMPSAGFKASSTGIGINTGRTLIGVLGTETRMEPTSIGDTVNLASRTESLCKSYGARLLITEYTLEKMGSKAEDFIIRLLDHVAVKGKNKACKLYEVIDGESPDTKHLKMLLLDNYTTGIDLFIKGDFEQSKRYFQKCIETYRNDKPSLLYIQRCEEMLKMENFDITTWDGIYKLSSK